MGIEKITDRIAAEAKCQAGGSVNPRRRKGCGGENFGGCRRERTH